MISLPEIPSRIASLPRDHRGYPVPWFVPWIDGKPIFHAADGRKPVQAVKESRCWICGESLGRYRAFVIGPMCSVNRISAEPPMHLECAEFSVKACPFLTKPKMRRMEPIEGGHKGAGIMLDRNPGVCCLWVCKKYEVQIHNKGILFLIGDPESVRWFAEGRTATRGDVLESVETGLPLLRGQFEDPESEAILQGMLSAASVYFPIAEAEASCPS